MKKLIILTLCVLLFLSFTTSNFLSSETQTEFIIDSNADTSILEEPNNNNNNQIYSSLLMVLFIIVLLAVISYLIYKKIQTTKQNKPNKKIPKNKIQKTKRK